MAYRNYGISHGFIVDKSGNGDFTTIQAAITAATSGVTIGINPGTYTENLTLKAGVNLSAFSGLGGSVQITGKMIDNGATVGVTITDINLTTNSDYFLALTGSASSITLQTCNLNCSNNTGMSVASGCTVITYSCTGNLGTTGIGYFTGAGTFILNESHFLNGGSSLTASTVSGSCTLYNCSASCAFATSSSGIIKIFNSIIDTSPFNITCLTTAGTGSHIAFESEFSSGTASAISVGSGTTLTAGSDVIQSTNTNAITGAGTLIYAGLQFTSSSSLMNVTTMTGKATNTGSISFDGGTNLLSSYVFSGSFTPTLTFGGGSTGITYTTQTGVYMKIGTVVFISVTILLSSKGSSTGTASITGLPFADTTLAILPVSAQSLTFTGLINARISGGGGANVNLDQYSSGGSRTQLDNTAFSNTTLIQFSGFYKAS